MVLFRLPQELTQCILNDWLNDAKTISTLDVACSTDELRDEFLHLIRHPQFVLSVLEADGCAGYIKWLSARKVKTTTLVVDVRHLAEIAAITFLRLPSVTTLKVRHKGGGHPANPEHLAYLLKRCPALTCFDDDCSSEDADIDDVEILGLLLVPSTPLRSLLLRECFNLQNSTIRSVVFGFRHTLRELVVGNLLVPDAILDFIALACPNLQVLHVCGQYLHKAAVLRYCAAVGDRLRHFELVDYNEYEDKTADKKDDFVCKLADRLPIAEEIHIGGFVGNTCRSLQHVLDHCPNIVYAFATWQFELNSNKTCGLMFQMEPGRDIFPFMMRLPYTVTDLDLEYCTGMTEGVVAPFVAKHGPNIEWLDVAVEHEVPDVSTGGLIVLLNGCVNAHTIGLGNWRGLDEEATSKLFPNRHPHLTTLDFTNLQQLTDNVLALVLDRCPVLKILDINRSPLLTDRSLETIARTSETIRTWSLHGTAISTTGLVKLALQLPLCPFDSISVDPLPELKTILMSMGDVGRIWIKTMELQ